MEISAVQLALIVLTIAVVLGAGLFAARSVHSAEGFSLGGRSAGVPLVAGTIAGTCVGGGATVGTAQLANTVGLSAWWFTIGTGLALIIMGIFYARPLRSSALTTIPEYLVKNYGRAGGVFTSVVSSLGILFSAVSSSLPAIFIIAAIFSLASWQAAGVLLLLTAAYAFFGGMKSAGVGGILKMVVIWVSMLIAGGAAAYAIFFQPEVRAALPAGGFNLFAGGTGHALGNLASVIVGMICTQTYVQAIFSAATPRTASVGAFVAAAVSLPVGLPCALIGMYMHAAHPEVTAILALPTFLLSYQPTVLGSIAMGGIMLSLVGSVAGLTLGIGTMLSRDLLAPALHIRGGVRELYLTRFVVLLTIAVAASIALMNQGSQVLFWSYLSMALRGGGIFLPLTVAVFLPRAIERHWAVASMVLSTAAALVADFLGAKISPLFVGLLTSAFLILPGLFTQRRQKLARAARIFHHAGVR